MMRQDRAGVNGAIPGVAMMANPKKGMPSYIQASIPGRETITAEVAKAALPEFYFHQRGG